MPRWLWLHVYGLVDFLDFVDVLFHRGVFEYFVFCSGLYPIYVCVGGRGIVSYICKTYLCTPRKPFWWAKNEGARDVWEFHRSPWQLLSSMVECIVIPEVIHATTILDNCEL